MHESSLIVLQEILHELLMELHDRPSLLSCINNVMASFPGSLSLLSHFFACVNIKFAHTTYGIAGN